MNDSVPRRPGQASCRSAERPAVCGDGGAPAYTRRRGLSLVKAVVLIALTASMGCRAESSKIATTRPLNVAAAQETTQLGGEPGEPVLNPSPRQVVRIHGRLPRHLRLAIYHRYAAESTDEGCARLVGKGSLQILANLGVTDAAPVRQTGDRFESELVVDRYLPGPCRWTYVESRGNVWKAPAPDPNQANLILFSGERYNVDDRVPGCPRPPRKDGTGCQEERYWRLGNHDEAIPIQLRCRNKVTPGFAGSPDEHRFSCHDFDDSYKKEHLVMPFTRTIEVNVYDVDIEAAPAPAPVRKGTRHE